MREHRQIVKSWCRGSATVLVTLVRVQGSSYRQPGARLVINQNGTYEGGISAGCLETDVLRKAAWLVREGATVERYSTLFDETADIPFGLGCGGVLDVLLERVETPECEAILQAMQEALGGSERHIATWLPTPDRKLMRAVFSATGQLGFASEGLSNDVLSEARIGLFHNEGPKFHGMFTEKLVAPQRLYVFGAGDDAKPLVTLACLLGWNVTVVDGRGHLARKNRFPESNVKVDANPKDAIGQVHARDAAVIMTHSYEQDKEYLAALLPLRLRYLGLLGSRQRSALLISEVAAALDYSLSECCENLCAPIGLDIGGEGAEAIALAIVAEAQACFMGKLDQSRKLSVESVQRHLANSGPQQFGQTQCAIGMS